MAETLNSRVRVEGEIKTFLCPWDKNIPMSIKMLGDLFLWSGGSFFIPDLYVEASCWFVEDLIDKMDLEK